MCAELIRYQDLPRDIVPFLPRYWLSEKMNWPGSLDAFLYEDIEVLLRR